MPSPVPPPGDAPGTGTVRVEQSPKRVRGLLGGRLVFDTCRALLVWEGRPYPAYYVPAQDVLATLEPASGGHPHPELGQGAVFDVRVGGRLAPAAARTYPEAPAVAVREAVRFEWQALDEWLEEDEPVYVHPRSPYVRVDVLASSRRIRLALDGTEVAASDQPRILFETGIRPRYYLPLTHVRTELLVPSPTVTRCPYKGTASYWSVQLRGRLYRDYVWTYRSPLPECTAITGLLAFYDERMDLTVDPPPGGGAGGDR